MRGLPLALVVALGSISLPLRAAAPPAPHGPPKLMRQGWGFACGQAKDLQAQKSGTNSVAACAQVGPLQLGMDRSVAEKLLGQSTIEKSFGNTLLYVYALQLDETKHMITYAVIGYDSNRRITSIQLTGVPWEGAWSFADIKLGDSGKSVVARLGEPHGVSPGSEKGTLLWDYLPWTFSFEVKGPVVSTIRVSE